MDVLLNLLGCVFEELLPGFMRHMEYTPFNYSFLMLSCFPKVIVLLISQIYFVLHVEHDFILQSVRLHFIFESVCEAKNV